VLPEEFDELSPKEELYYQKPPFSTNEVFLGSKGGVSQLVDHGPSGVRQGYGGKKGMVFSKSVIQQVLADVKGMKGTPVDLDLFFKKYDVTERSSQKHIRDRLITKGYKIKQHPVSRQVQNIINKFAKYESSVDREKLQNLYELIVDANKTDTGLLHTRPSGKLYDKSRQFLMAEAGYGKTMHVGANRFAEELFDRHLVSTKNKMRAALKNMLSNENIAFDEITQPIKQIAKRFGVDYHVMTTALKDYPFYKQNKDIITRLGHANFIKKWKGQDLLFANVIELSKSKSLRPYFNQGIEGNIQHMAYRHWKAGGTKINFLTNPDQYPDPKDWEFEYKGKKYDYLDLAQTQNDPNFKNVWKAFDNAKQYEEFMITDPKILNDLGFKKPTQLGTIMRKAYGVGTGKEGYFRARVKDIDHFGSVLDEPFENVRALDARINRAAGNIDAHMTSEDAIKAKKKIGYFQQVDYSDPKAFAAMVEKDLNLAVDIKRGRKLRTPYKIAQSLIPRSGGPVLGSNLANVTADMFDFRKLPGDVRHFADIAARYGAKSPALLSALKKAKGAGKWTGLALAAEPAFAAPFAEYGYKMGESPERLWGDATFGLFGETEQEELKKAVGERGYATQQIDNYGSTLQALGEKWNSLNDQNDPRGETRQVIKNMYKHTRGKYNKAYNMFVDEQGEFDKGLYDQALNNYTAGLVQIDKFKKQKQAERIEQAGGYDNILQEREIRDIKGFAGGGLTRTVAPDSGPVSRGLRSLYIDDMD